MRAMVFAAGYGSRLGNITKSKPKCLVDIGGSTMLELVLKQLKNAGVNEVMINLFHLGDLIREYVEKNKSFGLQIHFSEEEELLGTGGGLKKAQYFFRKEKEFFVHNSDVFSNLDLNKLLEEHKKNSPLATLAVMDRQTNRPLLFDEKGLLSGWENLTENSGESFGGSVKLSHLAFSGIQVMSPKIFDYMTDDTGSFSTMRIFMRAAKSGESIKAFRMDESYWIDMGTPDKLEELRTLLSKDKIHN